MELDASPTCRRPPMVLLGRRGPALTALTGSPALRSCFMVSLPRDEEVARLVPILRPTAVVLESSEFYLDGRRIHAAFTRSSPGTRVLFLDLEGPWALWIEIESVETGALRIAPCGGAEAADELLDLLREPGAPEPRRAASA